MPGVPGGIGDIGGGIGDIFSGLGELSESKSYRKADQYARQNAVIAQESGDIKSAQTERQIYKTLGQQGAGYASAGLTGGGSAQSVLRNSISQGSLEKSIVNEQTQINVTGYEEQAAQFQGMAAAAHSAGIGGIIKGVLGVAAGAAMMSDRRLKTDIERVGSHGKLGIYSFRFLWEGTRRVGVMADEVAVHAPYALGPPVGGYASVDYAKLGLQHLVV